MLQRLRIAAAVIGVLCLVTIIFVTLSPIDWRPKTGEPANIERFLAFMALAGAFVLAWPRRWALTLVLILAGGGGLEAAQNLLPDRHGAPLDFFAKAMGAAAGAVLALAVDYLAKRLQPRNSGA